MGKLYWSVRTNIVLQSRNYRYSSMKKIGKALAIRIDEDNSESPSPAKLRDSQPQTLRPPTQPDSDDDPLRNDLLEHLANVVEFEQFLVDDEKHSSNLPKIQSSVVKPASGLTPKAKKEQTHFSRSRREFFIEIPEVKSSTVRNMGGNAPSSEREGFRQPPAPSNKKSLNSKSFVFPEADHKQSARGQILKTESNSVEELMKSFDRERQEFYREKSRFEKEILVKQGQIEMLQRMLTGRIGGQTWNIPEHHSQQMEAILLEKDAQIGDLLGKIAELSRQLSTRGQELREAKLESSRLETANESLLNHVYLLERKELSSKTTQQFYEIKQIKASTPTGRGWDGPRKEELKYSGLEDLQKRLQNLHNNRKELQEREKIKSEVNYSHSGKYKQEQPYIRGYPEYSRNKF